MCNVYNMTVGSPNTIFAGTNRQRGTLKRIDKKRPRGLMMSLSQYNHHTGYQQAVGLKSELINAICIKYKLVIVLVF